MEMTEENQKLTSSLTSPGVRLRLDDQCCKHLCGPPPFIFERDVEQGERVLEGKWFIPLCGKDPSVRLREPEGGGSAPVSVKLVLQY